MSIDESETLLDSSLTSGLNILPATSSGDFQPHHHHPAYVRESSLGSINTQSTTLTGNSKLMSPAVTVVDIDLKSRSIDQFDEIHRTTTHHQQRKLRRRKSYEGINNDETSGGGSASKTKSSSMLLAIGSSQNNISRDGLEPQSTGKTVLLT